MSKLDEMLKQMKQRQEPKPAPKPASKPPAAEHIDKSADERKPASEPKEKKPAHDTKVDEKPPFEEEKAPDTKRGAGSIKPPEKAEKEEPKPAEPEQKEEAKPRAESDSSKVIEALKGEVKALTTLVGELQTRLEGLIGTKEDDGTEGILAVVEHVSLPVLVRILSEERHDSLDAFIKGHKKSTIDALFRDIVDDMEATGNPGEERVPDVKHHLMNMRYPGMGSYDDLEVDDENQKKMKEDVDATADSILQFAKEKLNPKVPTAAELIEMLSDEDRKGETAPLLGKLDPDIAKTVLKQVINDKTQLNNVLSQVRYEMDYAEFDPNDAACAEALGDIRATAAEVVSLAEGHLQKIEGGS